MKEKLLEALAETRKREAELVGLCTETPPDPSGRWRPQDHLAHISWWRDREARLIDAARTGVEPPQAIPEGHDQNTVIYEATRDQPAADVIAGAGRSWDLLEKAIEACSEKDLERAHPERPNRMLIDGSPGDHLAAHIFWCQIEAGNEQAAEAVLRWAQELSSRTTTDQRTRGVGAYNLACFYARTRRVDEALPLLRQGFELAPDLKDWSHKDPDLDPIRDDPRVMELLGAKV
jgi:tetratricopeptide (TPR) repeat protein